MIVRDEFLPCEATERVTLLSYSEQYIGSIPKKLIYQNVWTGILEISFQQQEVEETEVRSI